MPPDFNMVTNITVLNGHLNNRINFRHDEDGIHDGAKQNVISEE